MGKQLIFLSILANIFFSLLATEIIADTDYFKGPLNTRNQFPVFMMFLNPMPATALPLPEKAIRLSPAVDYSSVYVDQDSGNWEVVMDMELMVVDLTMEYGLTRNLTLRLQPVFVHMSRGFLDNFLESYHDRLGVSNGGRESRPQDAFGYWIYYDNQEWLTGKEGGLHLADSQVSMRYCVVRNSKAVPVDFSVAYILKIPLGDAAYGFGSGKFDHGIHLLSRLRLDPVSIYLNGGYNILSDPETNGADIKVDNTVSLFAGLEYAYSPDLSLIVQTNYFASPFRDVAFSQFEEGGFALDLGFVVQLSRQTMLEFAFGEDLAASGAPDFNLHFRVSWSIP